MHNIIRLSSPVLFFLALLLPFQIQAVTKKEMEQARTIAAKSYIRYVNDGSGYLDQLNPATIEELQAQLKPKEKENIKAFLAIEMPKDYENWGKEQLLDYWAGTVFKSKGLVEKGRGGRIMARREINKMTLGAPETPAEPSVSEKTQAAQSAEPASPASAAETPPVDSLSATNPAPEELDNYTEDYDIAPAANYTWVYIMILAILVAVVIALVVYAANVLKKNSLNSTNGAASQPADAEELEKYRSQLADKDYEISMLKKKLETATRQNAELKSKIETLSAKASSSVSANPGVQPAREPKPDGRSGSSLRYIYLGRANAKGLFVRADRNLNVGNSIFILDTPDGFSGSFRVADSPAAWSLALSNPAEYLMNACTGHNLEDTKGAEKIVTESSGTAIFEGGCWKVIRKAKIRYE